MLKILSAAGMALALLAAGVAAPVGIATAQDVELRIGPDGIRPIIRDRDRDRERGRDRMRDRCGPREARAAARDAGLRDPEIIRETRSRIVVEGLTRRGVDRITFANARGCPEI